MTVVHVALSLPSADGELLPAAGYLQFTPTARRALDGVVILPASFQARLVDGLVDVELAPNEPGSAWRIEECVTGVTGRSFLASIPADGPVNYADLVPLDPATLDPAPTTDPAWAAFAVTPDPANPGFYLIGTN